MWSKPLYAPLLLLALFSVIISFAQQPDVINTKYYINPLTYGGNFFFCDIQRARDNGIILAGVDSSAAISKGNIIDKSTSWGGSGGAWAVKIDSSGIVQWNIANSFYNSGAMRSIQPTIDGGYINAGYGNNVAGEGKIEYGDFIIMKMDATGKPQWQKRISGSGLDMAYNVIQISSGNYVAVGTTNSNDNGITGNHNPGTNDGLAIKVGQSGTVLWQKMFGGTGYDTIHAVVQTPDNGFLMAGSSTSSDGDVPGNKGKSDGWLFKADSSGNILWKRNFGGTENDVFENLVLTPDGGILVSGFTFSNNGNVSGNHGQADIWTVKTDMNGNLLWSKCFGGSGEDYCLDMKRSLSGDALLSGFTESTDGDVSGQHGGADAWLLSVSTLGSLLWQKCIGTPANEYGTTGLPLSDHDFVLAGAGDNPARTRTYGTFDGMLAQLGNVNIVKGNVFLDANLNGARDAGEYDFDKLTIKAVNSRNGDTRSTSPFHGQYRLPVDTGTFVNSVVLNSPYFSVTPVSKTSSFASYFNIDSIDFAVQPLSPKKDLAITALSLSAARLPSSVNYKLVYENTGTEPITNVTVKMIKDHRIEFNNAVPAPSQQLADTLLWNFTQLNPATSGVITITLGANNLLNVHLGDTLHFMATIGPVAGDETPADDTSYINQQVVGSFDPNDKTEMNGGVITPEQVASGDYLHYLIRFQNTGNDTAFAVSVRDTLDSRLDWNTLQMVDASHSYSLQSEGGNKLIWTFDNILLVDSVHNEPASHGYIAYRIKPRPAVAAGDTIPNSAAIYFDYNLPVKTNTNKTAVAANFALPVYLLNWNAVLKTNQVDLSWQTTHEAGTDHFEVQRSTDGNKFVSIGNVAAKNSRVGASYQLSDPGFENGVNYYRLKIIDADGKFSYSNVLVIKAIVDKSIQISIYPNPSNGIVAVNLQGTIKGNALIKALDFSGKTMLTYDMGKIDASAYSTQVNLTSLPKGIYVMQVQVGDQTWRYKQIIY